jgi:hypothetical protein
VVVFCQDYLPQLQIIFVAGEVQAEEQVDRKWEDAVESHQMVIFVPDKLHRNEDPDW